MILNAIVNHIRLHFIAIFRIRFIIGLLCSLLIPRNGNGQETGYHNEIKFIHQLLLQDQFEPAIKAVGALMQLDIHQGEKDTLNYYSAMANYKIRNYEESLKGFSHIGPGSNFSMNTGFYISCCYTLLNRNSESVFTLANMNNLNPVLTSFKTYFMASNFLLERNTRLFDSISLQFTSPDPSLESEYKRLWFYHSRIKKEKNKSPLLAATMSAFVPGLGKYYAGYRAQALSGFLSTAFYGICTWESYHRMQSFKNHHWMHVVPVITFGTLFTVYYFGNITGSAKSVRTFKERSRKKINEEILSDLLAAHHRLLD